MQDFDHQQYHGEATKEWLAGHHGNARATRNRLAFISVGQRLHKEGEQLIVCSLSLSCIDHAGVVVLEVPTNAHHAA